ncbi:hypothetical protein [Streptomyces sp. NPDC048411]|uniref:hypothetical protein n=1 Tax=Streptomyces sp. NPDC048411 TaxID=3157206 RepID=UPI003451BE12
MSAVERAGLLRLPEERDSDGTTQFNRLKQTEQGPSWSHFKRLFTHLEWLDKARRHRGVGGGRRLAEGC